MKIEREALLAAIRAANFIVNPDHSIHIFTKVWILENYVLGFNSSGMTIKCPCELPAIGGVEGKLLAQLLDRMEAETIDVTTDAEGSLVLDDGTSVLKLPVTQESDIVLQLGIEPRISPARVSFDISHLFEDISLGAMLQLTPPPHETSPDFSSLIVEVNEQSKAYLYSSDRSTINRSTLELDEAAPGRYLLPLELIRTLAKLRSMFEEGIVAFDKENIIFVNDNTILFCRLLQSVDKPDFEGAIRKIWPDGKLKPKIMVPLPDRLKEIITQALLICKDEDALVKIDIRDGTLTLSTQSEGKGKFSASIEFNHPPASIRADCKRILQAIPHSRKMLILQNAIAFRGPNQFWRFIAGRA